MWLRALRLVSRDFDHIIKPYAYHYIKISDTHKMARIMSGASQTEGVFRDNIMEFAKVVTLGGTPERLLFEDVQDTLRNCKSLQSIRYVLHILYQSFIFPLSTNRLIESNLHWTWGTLGFSSALCHNPSPSNPEKILVRIAEIRSARYNGIVIPNLQYRMRPS